MAAILVFTGEKCRSPVGMDPSKMYPPAAPPTIAAISPNQGPIAGGNLLTISGSGFYSDSSVTVNSAPCELQSSSDTALACSVPESAIAGAGPVVVTNWDGQSATAAEAYTYE
jgi:hypothetical protein